MGQEGKSINRVKFQTIPASTKHERNSDPADSGKKDASRSGAVPLYLRFSEMKGINFFARVQDLFDDALSPQYKASHWGSICIKGNVLRGEI